MHAYMCVCVQGCGTLYTNDWHISGNTIQHSGGGGEREDSGYTISTMTQKVSTYLNKAMEITFIE